MSENPQPEQFPASNQPQPHKQFQLERIATGITGLDTILRGGLLKGDSYILMGAPGSGKTILANQMAFNHIASGGRVVFLTVMTETHTRMIAHLRALSFFNHDAVSDTMYYISGYSSLEKQGLEGLLSLCRTVLRDKKATLLILDGLATAEDFAPSEIDFKTFIKHLDSYSEVHGCTILMLTHRAGGSIMHPEYTMVDGLIELKDESFDLRTSRYLEVLKFRGSGFIGGRHHMEINSDGIVVYPRTEANYVNPYFPPQKVEREQFGIKKLDENLGGGLFKGTTTLVFGPTGSGKTSLGLQFLYNGLTQGQTSVHFGFFEPPRHLVKKGRVIGLEFEPYLQSGQFEIVWQPPLEFSLDVLAERLLNVVRQKRPQRLFIDALGAFNQAALYPERIPRFWTALTNELRALDITSVFSFELPSIFGGTVEVPIQGISAISENIILLRLSEVNAELRYLISVLKERDSQHDRRVYELLISDQGLQIGPVFSEVPVNLNTISGGLLTSSAGNPTVEAAPVNPVSSDSEKGRKEGTKESAG